MRCIRFWWLWVPQILRKQSWLTINSRVVMGATYTEKAQLASEQLKDFAQTWCNMWQYSRVLGEVSVTSEFFKTTFLERFFPKDMRTWMR